MSCKQMRLSLICPGHFKICKLGYFTGQNRFNRVFLLPDSGYKEPPACEMWCLSQSVHYISLTAVL